MTFKYSPQEARQLWCTALESGKFLRGRHWLKAKTPDAENWSYCCLGVAVELYLAYEPDSARWLEEKIVTLEDGIKAAQYNGPQVKEELSALPIPVRRWLKMFDCCGTVKTGYLTKTDGRMHGHIALATLNDATDLTFTEISELIKRTPLLWVETPIPPDSVDSQERHPF